MWRLVSTWDRPGRAADAADAADLGARAGSTLGSVVASHGIDVAPQPSGNSVVWCSQVRTVGQDADPDDPGWCTDLWVHLDASAGTIAVALEGHGLAEHVTGRSHWDGPIDVELDDDLDTSLDLVADHLDRFCRDVIVTEQPDRGPADTAVAE